MANPIVRKNNTPTQNVENALLQFDILSPEEKRKFTQLALSKIERDSNGLLELDSSINSLIKSEIKSNQQLDILTQNMQETVNSAEETNKQMQELLTDFQGFSKEICESYDKPNEKKDKLTEKTISSTNDTQTSKRNYSSALPKIHSKTGFVATVFFCLFIFFILQNKGTYQISGRTFNPL